MARKLLLPLFLIGALLCLPALAQARPPHGFYGVTPQTDLLPVDFKRMSKGGVGTLRVPLTWTDVDSGPISETDLFERDYNWREFDIAVGTAARRGIRILPTVYGTPQWVATFQGCTSGCHKLGPASIPAYIAFQEFMRAAVERYGPDGIFWQQAPGLPERPIRTWQIWNEQNSSDYWKPFPNVSDYANLLIAGGEAVHAADPGARVIPGGMIGEPAQDGKKTVSGWDFLAALYANPEARAAFDGIAIHPYGAAIHSVKRTVWRWRQELRAANALNDKIYVTEIGWASGGEDHPLNRGLRGQARSIREALEFFTAKRRKLNIATVSIYAWRDASPDAEHCSWCEKSGLLRYRNREPKPAWRVFKSFARG